MVGSILPGCSIEAGVYRPRRMSRESVCPVSRTEPWTPAAMSSNSRATSGPPTAGSTPRVKASVDDMGSRICGLLVGGSRAEGKDVQVDKGVPSVEQRGPGVHRCGRVGARLSGRERDQQHREVLV